MRAAMLWKRAGVAVCILFASMAVRGHDAAPKSPPEFTRWEPAIRAFEEQDAKQPPAKGGVVFVGSSSIRLWKLDESFPKLGALNRGFGGSQLADSVHFADRIVTKYEPRTVVLYAGDNDIAAGKTAEQVRDDFQAFVKAVRAKLPKAKILYIAIKPSIKRWKLADAIRAANAYINHICESDERLVFVDVFQPMLGDDGRPQPDLFVEDGLHLNARGYALWTKLLEPHLTADPQR